MRAVTPLTAADETPRRLMMGCPRCRTPMRELPLSSHKGAPVMVEQCPGCRLVWFDRFESVHLDAQGWVMLLREMEAAAKQPLTPAQVDQLACPVCAARLRTVKNQTRFGLFSALECHQGHGHLHSHSGLLAERGLVRPLGLAERRALAAEKLALHCLNCGGPAAAGDDRCRYCHTPLVVLDLPRLAHSLRPRAELLGASPQALGRHLNWPCRSCGAPLDPGRETTCSRCGHMVVAHELPDIDPLLDAAEASLAEEAARRARQLAGITRAQVDTGAGRRREASPLARVLMLHGWLPLLLMLGFALLVAAGAIVADAPWTVGRPPELALRDQRLAPPPASPWIWLEAHRLLQPGDREGRATLRRGLFDIFLRQQAGEALPPTLTVGQLLDERLPRPSGSKLSWDQVLTLHLRPVRGPVDDVLAEAAKDQGGRWRDSAPSVWHQIEYGSGGLWALAVKNTGPVTLPVDNLTVQLPAGDYPPLTWRCKPVDKAVRGLEAGLRTTLLCRTNSGPDGQEERWRQATYPLRSGEPLALAWHDDGMSASGVEIWADRWARDAAVRSPRLDAFMRRHTGLRQNDAPIRPPVLGADLEAPASLSLAQRWESLEVGARYQAWSAIALMGFVAFCGLARLGGERFARIVMGVVAVPLAWWWGHGEGAASVLLIGMYLALSGMAMFVFGFGYRSYRAIFFRRYGP